MKEFCQSNFAALVGIDWADRKHDICELPRDELSYQFSVISGQPESIHEWSAGLLNRYKGNVALYGAFAGGHLGTVIVGDIAFDFSGSFTFFHPGCCCCEEAVDSGNSLGER
jgi:hypothetical protein